MEHNDYGMDRHDDGSGWVALLALVMVSLLLAGTLAGLALFARPSDAASSIDATYPVAGSVAVSTPVRGNFSIAKSEISALQAKFPSSSATLGIATYADSSGSLASNGLCGLYDAGLYNVLTCTAIGTFQSDYAVSPSLTVIEPPSGTTVAGFYRSSDSGAPLIVYDHGIAVVGDSAGDPAVSVETGLIDPNEPGFLVNEVGLARFQVLEGGRTSISADHAAPALRVSQTNASARVALLTVPAENDDPTEDVRAFRASTSNNTAANIGCIEIATDKVRMVSANVVARVRADTNAEKGVAYTVTCLGKNDGGVLTVEGTPDIVETGHADLTSGFTSTCAADDTNNKICVTVEGDASNTVSWHAVIRSYEIGS